MDSTENTDSEATNSLDLEVNACMDQTREHDLSDKNLDTLENSDQKLNETLTERFSNPEDENPGPFGSSMDVFENETFFADVKMV